MAHQVMPAVFVLYTSYRFGWSGRDLGLALAAVGICNILVQGFLVRLVVPRLGERRTMLVGLLFAAAANVIYGLAPTGRVFALAIPVGALMGLFNPSLQGLLTRRVDPSAQGQLQGATGSLQGLTGLVGPGLFSFTFALFIGAGAPGPLPGEAFVLSAVLVLAAFGLGWRVTREG